MSHRRRQVAKASIRSHGTRWIAAMLLHVLAGVGGGTAHAAIHVVDDRGVTIDLPMPPQRIVSLLPSLTETVCALGRCPLLVGVDSDSAWPLSIRSLPRLGQGLDPNVEAVVALKPDVVLMARSSLYVQRLESLGIKVVAIEPKSHADIQRQLLRVAQVVGEPSWKAVAVWDEVDRQLAAAAQSVNAGARGARVYFEVDQTPYAAAPTSFIGETLARLGVRNIIPSNLGPFPKINPEFVVRADPDVIIAARTPGLDLAQRPGWSTLRAVRGSRICNLGVTEMQLVERPGPRLGEAAQVLASCLNASATRQGEPRQLPATGK